MSQPTFFNHTKGLRYGYIEVKDIIIELKMVTMIIIIIIYMKIG